MHDTNTNKYLWNKWKWNLQDSIIIKVLILFLGYLNNMLLITSFQTFVQYNFYGSKITSATFISRTSESGLSLEKQRSR